MCNSFTHMHKLVVQMPLGKLIIAIEKIGNLNAERIHAKL